jgi:hypothetical protein
LRSESYGVWLWDLKGEGRTSALYLPVLPMVYKCFYESFRSVSRFHRVSWKDVGSEQLCLSLALVRCEVFEAREEKIRSGSSKQLQAFILDGEASKR